MAEEQKQEFWRWPESDWKNPEIDWNAAQFITVGLDRDYNLCIGCTRCVRACRDMRGIEALDFVFDKNGQIQEGSVAETLEDSGCKFCTACIEVCPTGALIDKSVEPATREVDLVPIFFQRPAAISR